MNLILLEQEESEKKDKSVAKGVLIYQLNKLKYGISCSDFMKFAKIGLIILEL